MNELGEKLSAPFEDADIEWRLQYANDEKGFGIAVPYVTNRAIQNRLDKTVGAHGWKNEFIPWHSDGKKASQLCGISIYFAERKEWITKFDGAEDSDIEPVKGGLSDSMKRAAVHWGIGRYLYSMDTVYVDIEKNGKTPVIAKRSQDKLNTAHQSVIKRLFESNTLVSTADKPATTVKQTPIMLHPSSIVSKTQNQYVVLDAVKQPSVRGVNMNLRLQCPDGHTISAFLQGDNSELIKDTIIENVVITRKEKEGIVFYTLDSFDMAASKAA